MNRFFRITTVALLPALTLALGWHLGARFEHKQLEDVAERLEFLYSGKSSSGQLVTDPEQEVDLALMWGVWRLMVQHYIAPEDLKAQTLIFGATRGLVKSVGDPYTTFMTPSENDDFRMSLQGKLEGIGAELTLKNEQIVIVAPLKGSPAAAAGLQPGDIILEVDGESIEGETLSQAVHRIRGERGSTVTLTILRKGEPDTLDIEIVRDEIKVPSVEYEIKETSTGSVAYIALNQFGENSIPEAKRAIESFKDKDIAGIVLDLRYNGGGYLEGAVELTSMFMRQGKVVTVRRRADNDDSHYVYGRPIFPDIPLAVLINEGSASASEIVAGAFQSHERAFIIGKKSFGKGTIQEVLELPGGSSLRVTTAKWLTPDGHDLSEEGVIPDLEIDRTREDFDADLDPQLNAALEWILDGEIISQTEMLEGEEVAD